eukprot:6177773-Pleurochrysis_carterae.AAC.2
METSVPNTSLASTSAYAHAHASVPASRSATAAAAAGSASPFDPSRLPAAACNAVRIDALPLQPIQPLPARSGGPY